MRYPLAHRVYHCVFYALLTNHYDVSGVGGGRNRCGVAELWSRGASELKILPSILLQNEDSATAIPGGGNHIKHLRMVAPVDQMGHS